MKKFQFITTFLFSLFITTGMLVAVAQTSSAALEQPAGEFPITQPLKPIDPGSKPNYSGNIQDGEPVLLQPTEEEELSPESAPGVITTDGEMDVEQIRVMENDGFETSGGNGKLWFIALAAIIVIGVVALFLWRRGQVSKTTTALVLAFFLFTGFATINSALAQPAPIAPQQRTITAEEDVVEEGQILPSSESNRSAYMVTVIGLLLIAGGALYLFWTQTKPYKVEEPKQKPRPKKR